MAYNVLAPGGTLVVVLPSLLEEINTKEIAVLVGYMQDPAQKDIGLGLIKALPSLLESGKIKVSDGCGYFQLLIVINWLYFFFQPNNYEVIPNGLAGIPDGLERLKAGMVSATKLVARPWET